MRQEITAEEIKRFLYGDHDSYDPKSNAFGSASMSGEEQAYLCYDKEQTLPEVVSVENPAREFLNSREGRDMRHWVVTRGNNDIVKPSNIKSLNINYET